MICSLDTHELAWAAGFFDGEGSTVIHRHGRDMPSIGLSISQSTGPALLLRFQRAAGGLGLVAGPYATKGGLPVHQFRTYGFTKVQAIVAMLWPWLGDVKRAQAVSRLDELAARQRDLITAREACTSGHRWVGDGAARGSTFSINIRGTKICRICIREAGRLRNDEGRQRPYKPRKEALTSP